MSSSPKNRIIFLDLMRALAVIMMIQGHTIDTFLGDQYRTVDSDLYNIWFTIRGFTAPIFMFVSGVTFTYLLRSQSLPFFENPRVNKGVHRFMILILIGYLLRFPTPRMFDFSEVDHSQWLTFFTVDALHLIAFGILFILLLSYIAEKYKRSDYLIFSLGAAFFFFMFLLTENPLSFSTKQFSYKLFLFGVISLVFCYTIHVFEDILYSEKTLWTDNTALIFYRLGIILMLNSLMSFISLKIKNIPDIISKLGKNTLLVYAVHVIILYGSAWIPGFGMFYSKTLNIPFSILAAILLIVFMFWFVSLFERMKNYRRRKIVAVEI